ncbi:hypothetical protein SAMN05443543_11512 [Flavobacterium flevense]|uniref:Uncharacterized protein n=2 Tax=Flavobacterium flevense TaxID=983 RepID=A0A4Y4B0G3_9FLAO|nr:hypothetical protein FFL01_22990 [Flavobacterium flevense]SHM16367.1 hypothetical protein SAMN05443543_11512 [Flavobacterium flevense]
MLRNNKPKLKLHSKLLALLFILTTFISCTDTTENTKQSLETNKSITQESAINSKMEQLNVSVINQTIVTNLTQSGGPDINYLRGMALGGNGGFVDTNTNPKTVMDLMSTNNFKAINGIRNLYKEPKLGNGEFYKEGTVYKNRQQADYTNIRNYAKNKGFVIINQVAGTPDNTSNPLYPLDTSYFTSDGDYVPLPTTGASMQAFQDNYVQWALAADQALGANYHSIWIGHQEPTHTLGTKVPTTDATKKENINRFVDYWKPIAAGLKAGGAKVGGIQLPSDANGLYQYAVDRLKLKQVDVDYLTFQFYRWGEPTAIASAISALNSYNQTYSGTKIIIDRGHWHKECCDGIISEAVTTSKGMIDYLKGEKLLMDDANLIYAAMYDNTQTNANNLQWKIHSWLNNTSNKRRPLTGLPAGINGFALGGTSAFYAVIWSKSANTNNITLRVDGSTFSSSANLVVKKASDTNFTTVTSTWNSTAKTIGPITMLTNEIYLISLKP